MKDLEITEAVLNLRASGLSTRKIAEELGIGKSSVSRIILDNKESIPGTAQNNVPEQFGAPSHSVPDTSGTTEDDDYGTDSTSYQSAPGTYLVPKLVRIKHDKFEEYFNNEIEYLTLDLQLHIKEIIHVFTKFPYGTTTQASRYYDRTSILIDRLVNISEHFSIRYHKLTYYRILSIIENQLESLINRFSNPYGSLIFPIMKNETAQWELALVEDIFHPFEIKS